MIVKHKSMMPQYSQDKVNLERSLIACHGDMVAFLCESLRVEEGQGCEDGRDVSKSLLPHGSAHTPHPHSTYSVTTLCPRGAAAVWAAEFPQLWVSGVRLARKEPRVAWPALGTSAAPAGGSV